MPPKKPEPVKEEPPDLYPETLQRATSTAGALAAVLAAGTAFFPLWLSGLAPFPASCKYRVCKGMLCF